MYINSITHGATIKIVQSRLCLSADDWNKDFLVHSRISVPSTTTVC